MKEKRFFKTLAATLAVIAAGALFTTTAAPVGAAASEPVHAVSKAAYVIEAETGKVLYSRNENERLQIASMVKIMTVLLSLEAESRGEIAFDEGIEISETAAGMGGSQVFLEAGTVHKFQDLLKTVIVASANDSSVAIAERLGGSEAGFVKKMNSRAAELGMNDTLFSNATGLPAAGQYSTAADVSKMTAELVKYDKYHELSKIWLEDYVHPDGRITTITNTNKLVRFYKGCDGGKTGFTGEAGFCLSASAVRNGMRVIATVAGAPTSKERNKEVSDLFDYAFAEYENKVILEKGKPADVKVNVSKGKQNKLDITPARDLKVLAARGENPEYTLTYNLPDKVTAPVKAGDVIGEAVITYGGNSYKVPMLAAEDVGKAGFRDILDKITGKK